MREYIQGVHLNHHDDGVFSFFLWSLWSLSLSLFVSFSVPVLWLTSGMPPTQVVTTYKPQLVASSMAMQKASVRLQLTKMSP